MLIASILVMLLTNQLCCPLPSDKFRIDTSILHKLRRNESLVASTGVANDFMRRVSTTTSDPHGTPQEEFFNPRVAGNLEECEGVMAVLSVTLKDPVYRRRWDNLVMMGYNVLVDSLIKTSDPTFYMKDIFDMAHTVDGQHAWNKVLLFVKSWGGVADYYRFVEMIDMMPDDQMFKDVKGARMFYQAARTSPTTGLLIMPSTLGVIIPDI